jgi:hypothetical protein
MITGLSLRALEATAVVLRRTENGYRPVTLGIAGTYDRLGKIDGIWENTNTELVLSYFRRLAGGPRLYLHDSSSRADLPWNDPANIHEQLTDIEQLLNYFERNGLHILGYHEPAASLDGDLLVLALIAQPVWDALAAAVPADPAALTDRFGSVFGDEPAADEIYRARLAQVADEVRQAYGVTRFLTDRGLHWLPWAEPSPRYGEMGGGQYNLNEELTFLETARADYADIPALQPVFDDLDRELRKELGEQPDNPSGNPPGPPAATVGRKVARRIQTTAESVVLQVPD